MSRFRLLLPLGCAALLLTAAGCPKRPLVGRVDTPVGVVERYLAAMVAGDQQRMAGQISPRWLADAGIGPDQNMVNSYSGDGFRIAAVSGDEVTASLSIPQASPLLLKFRVREEGGRYYLVPGKLDKRGWIDPWTALECVDR